MGQVIQSSLRDVFPLMWKRLWLYALVAAVLALLAGLRLEIPTFISVYGDPVPIEMKDVAALILGFFITAEVFRTAQPDYRMTAIQVLAIIGLWLSYCIAGAVGFVLLIIPGYIVLVKLWPLVWAYLSNEDDGPYVASWRLTTGEFWETFGIIATSIAVTYAFEYGVPRLAWIPRPAYASVFFLIAIAGTYFKTLLSFRWYLHLKEMEKLLAPFNLAESLAGRPLTD